MFVTHLVDQDHRQHLCMLMIFKVIIITIIVSFYDYHKYAFNGQD